MHDVTWILRFFQVLCAVITSRPRKNGTDKALKEGYLWLLHVIDQQYETLNERVTEDVRKRDIREKAEKAARDERVARAREERCVASASFYDGVKADRKSLLKDGSYDLLLSAAQGRNQLIFSEGSKWL